jgi:MbtH protein
VDNDDDDRIYTVVINHEEQYSIWLDGRPIPDGWHSVGVTGQKLVCLSHIDKVWTDMRPLSLRRRMAEREENGEESKGY